MTHTDFCTTEPRMGRHTGIVCSSSSVNDLEVVDTPQKKVQGVDAEQCLHHRYP